MKKSVFIILLIFLIFLTSCSNRTNQSYWSLEYQKINEYTHKDSDKKTKIAILDSGINSKYISNDIVKKQYNVITNKSETSDEFDHGTKIASIIADKKIGINTNVELFDIQILNNKGQTTVEGICKGIDKSIEYGVDIINMSIGFNSDNSKLKTCINKAKNKRIYIVASNGDTLRTTSDYPAAYNNVISIAAIDENKDLFTFASKGNIDFIAPGVDIEVKNNNGKYKKESGSSFATANFTAVLSLYLNKERKKKDIFIKNNYTSVKLEGNLYKMLFFNKKKGDD